MNFSPAGIWEDGDTCLNNSADRAGVLLIGIFAAILGIYIVPKTLAQLRSH